MPRHYVIQDWQNAAEYSGEMIGKRSARSQEMFLPNGKANIALFADEAPTTKKKNNAYQQIATDESKYEKLLNLSDSLDQQFEAGDIDTEAWLYARKKMDDKLNQAWYKICRERGWNAEEKDDMLLSKIVADKVGEALRCVESKQAYKSEKGVDNQPTFMDDVFSGLDDSNLFKQVYKFFKG